MRKLAKKAARLKLKIKATNPVGRPSKFTHSMIASVEKLCKLGATDKEIADFFGISESTLNEWKGTYPQFSESIKRGKIIADSIVSEKLFHRATGYHHDDVDIKMFEGKIITTKLTKHYPPDTIAAIFWLKNRRPAEWRDKQEVDLKNTDGSLRPVQIIAVSQETVNEIEKLK